MSFFAEAYRWTTGTSWLGLLNPLRTAQDVTVTVMGRDVARTVSVPPRGRVAVELGTWGLSGDFGLEVACESVCAASLVMWDADYKVAHESIPQTGCEAR